MVFLSINAKQQVTCKNLFKVSQISDFNRGSEHKQSLKIHQFSAHARSGYRQKNTDRSLTFTIISL